METSCGEAREDHGAYVSGEMSPYAYQVNHQHRHPSFPDGEGSVCVVEDGRGFSQALSESLVLTVEVPDIALEALVFGLQPDPFALALLIAVGELLVLGPQPVSFFLQAVRLFAQLLECGSSLG